MVQPAPGMVQNHALDPANKNILSLESALVSYKTQQQNEPMDTKGPQFDLMNILLDLDGNTFDN